ncbi:MAG: AtpZ/AtpI family protein [Holdemanella sp.]|nr:AtpZ/AtpI family protein [Holdemanella sp.]
MKPSALAGLLFTSLMIFITLGYFADEYLHTTPIFTLIGFAYSLFGSFYLFYKKNRDSHE